MLFSSNTNLSEDHHHHHHHHNHPHGHHVPMGGMRETHGHQNVLVSMGVVVQGTHCHVLVSMGGMQESHGHQHGHQNVLVSMGVVPVTETEL